MSPRLLSLILLAWSLLACAREDIVVAELDAPPPGGSRDDHHQGPPCMGNNDCAPEDFCERRVCGPEPGQCAPRPLSCEIGKGPVCGCDGATYPSECIRRAAGITASRPGKCGF